LFVAPRPLSAERSLTGAGPAILVEQRASLRRRVSDTKRTATPHL
jgi:hypothetical protein